MRKIILNVFVTVVALAIATPAVAGNREERRVADSADVLDQLLRIPEKRVPPSLLARAYAVAVVPNVVKVGFGVGARRGKGVLVVRQDGNSWSNPIFIKMTGGSIGWQIGAQSTDVILVFKSRKGVEDIAEGKFTLGADASVAAGPVGRHAEVATDWKFEAEVISYSRSRGLFGGVALEGAGVTIDHKANAAFYGSANMTADEILASSPNIAPDVANRFVQVLTAQTRRLPTTPGMQAEAATPVPAAADEAEKEKDDEMRTFGMPGNDESD